MNEELNTVGAIEGLIQQLKLLKKECRGFGIYKPEKTQDGSQLKIGSELHAVYKFLKKANKPIHIDIILLNIFGTVSQRKKYSLVGSLNAYAKSGRVFTKNGPNIFGVFDE